MDYSKQEFERLFKDSYPHMYRMAFSMVENADDAKDAVHQVFAQIWRSKPRVADDSIRGYLLAATRNQCLHLLRSRQLQRQMEKELQQDIAASEDEEHEELLQQLQQVIDNNLTEQDRRVLSLHYDEEMTYAETATVLGISASAVNKHITRSLAKIRTTDIDKKIGMPDVDAEWARFEREVIGEETQPKKHSLALWAWGIGIAASIAVVAGLFLFGNGLKGENEGSVAMVEENKSEVPKEKDANGGNAEKAITSNIIDNKSENLLAEVSDTETQDPLQRRIAGLDIVPNSSRLGANSG